MRKLIILTLTLLLNATVFVVAQEDLDPSKRERLEALKVAYLTKELNLTPEEAQQFWPVYNELEDKMHDLRKQKRDNRLGTKEGFAQMSDADLSKAIDRELALEQQELDLKKLYNERFKKILPIQKVARLHAAEHGFRKELLKGARDHRDHNGPPK